MGDKNFRLPRNVWPRRYGLSIVADLQRWQFQGNVQIDVQVSEPCTRVYLHAVDLQIEAVQAFWGGTWHSASRVEADADAEVIAIDFVEPLPVGSPRLDLAFRGEILARLRGFYRSEKDGLRYAATQFEAADARRAFPCFDEPEFKARFAVTLVVPAGTVAISNGPEISRRQRADGRLEFRFAETPPISSYLVAWCIGPFEATPLEFTPTGVPVRVWLPRGMAEKGAYALAAHAQSLAYLEDYTGIPYPYAKVDAIGVPDFEAGAMENPGAITYRLTVIAADPERASLPTRKAIFSTAAHELTHMWWGDLVTMAWWDDLWLNESFATFVGSKVTADLNPQWNFWRDFVAALQRPFQLDSLVTTHPISFPVANAKQATERFDVITYWKGAAVVRMIENFLGAENFQKGVRAYLQRHREANATAEDFWRELSTASGQPVAELARSWIRAPGHPILELRTTVQTDGIQVSGKQQRFFADPAQAETGHTTEWVIPVVWKYGTDRGIREHREVWRGATASVHLPGARWFYPNGSAAGFYRFLLDDAALHALVPAIQQGLAPHERLNLLDNQFALLRAARVSVAAYFRLLDGFRAETDRAVVSLMIDQLSWLWLHVIDDEFEPTFASFVEQLLRPQWESLGWELRPTESEDDRLRRAALLAALGSIARVASIRQEARARLERYWQDRQSLDPNLVTAVVNVAAIEGDRTLYERYLERKHQFAHEPEEEYRFLMALASFEHPALVQRTLELALSDEVRAQDRPFLLGALLGRRKARPAAWKFVRARWQTLTELLDPMLLQNLIRALGQVTYEPAATEVCSFLQDHVRDETRETTAQVCEQLRLDAAIVARLRAELPKALGATTQ
ncbi:MAG: M1 family metallopeptidase [Candidatus Binatia bacterium]|nr:M1 family metallopeptidase [Candidatus Binatia bacterium]